MIGPLLALLALSAEPVSIQREAGSFRVVGWVADGGDYSRIFRVYAGAGDVPPMLGTYTVDAGALLFRPRFAPAAGVPIRAVFERADTPAVVAVFDAAPVRAKAKTRVEQVFPSGDMLPANQLKFYLHFSAPMSRGEAWQHIRLLDGAGAPVDLPFLEVDQELWNRDNTRLTVLFDPGRIKRGVLPLVESGGALRTGGSYTLVIAAAWLDATGQPLAAEYQKEFRVAAEERRAVDPAKWTIATPAPGTRDPLTVTFTRPMDAALALRLINVAGVVGDAALAANETRWSFVPRDGWKPGAHEIVVDTALEDLAGNKVGRPFDVDVFEKVTEKVRRQTVSISFRIGRLQ